MRSRAGPGLLRLLRSVSTLSKACWEGVRYMVASSLSREPQSNCNSAFYSKGNFLRDSERPLTDARTQFPLVCKANDSHLMGGKKGLLPQELTLQTRKPRPREGQYLPKISPFLSLAKVDRSSSL